MKIDLIYFLNRNRITLAKFCEVNGIETYKDLCDHCEERKIKPVDLDFYNQNTPSKHKIEKKVNETPTKKSSTTRRSRKTSKVTKKRTSSSKDNT